MANYPREKQADYMRKWRDTPEGKASVSAYNRKKHRERWDSFTPEEKRCWNYRKKYKITLEEAKNILADQGGYCAICAKQLAIEDAVVDHNHSTQQVRGMLCQSCNKAVGFVYEDTYTLLSMIDYLQKWND